MSYILKSTCKGHNGPERLTDQQYKNLAENLKQYYRKYTFEDREEECLDGFEYPQHDDEDNY